MSRSPPAHPYSNLQFTLEKQTKIINNNSNPFIMKHYSRWLFGAFAAGLLVSCSSDVINPEGGTKLPNVPDKEGDGVYLSVNIKMPTADNTRS